MYIIIIIVIIITYLATMYDLPLKPSTLRSPRDLLAAWRLSKTRFETSPLGNP